MAGGGVLGTWHALELCRAGFTVAHLEADAAPQGASVRNFGLVWVSGRRTGAELDAAQRSRQRWEEVGTDIPGIGFRPSGSLTLATTDGERKVMEEFAAHPDAAARSITYVDPDEVVALNPAVRGEVAGGLYCTEDAIGRTAPRPGRAAGLPLGLGSPVRLLRLPSRAARASAWKTTPWSTPPARAGRPI